MTATVTASNTHTLSATPTLTWTNTNTATPSTTPTITLTFTLTATPNAFATPGCGLQVVNIFDDRGELIATLCGNTVFASGSTYSASLSSFVPNASGLGGAITIYLNNQPIAVWNGLDTKGQLVPNGFYHFSIIETTSGGNNIFLARDAFIDDDTGTGLLLSARPNLAHLGDTVTIFASFSGNPPDSTGKIKIYDLAGELLKTLSLVNGMTNWDLKNQSGNKVGTGLYLVVFDGNDPATGNPIRKAVKIMFIH
jgi:hypothetical protein